jgi:hypothetical protein
MTITLLGQGFENESENSVGKHLIKMLAEKDYNTFIGIGFATKNWTIFLSLFLI